MSACATVTPMAVVATRARKRLMKGLRLLGDEEQLGVLVECLDARLRLGIPEETNPIVTKACDVLRTIAAAVLVAARAAGAGDITQGDSVFGIDEIGEAGAKRDHAVQHVDVGVAGAGVLVPAVLDRAGCGCAELLEPGCDVTRPGARSACQRKSVDGAGAHACIGRTGAAIVQRNARLVRPAKGWQPFLSDVADVILRLAERRNAAVALDVAGAGIIGGQSQRDVAIEASQLLLEVARTAAQVLLDI